MKRKSLLLAVIFSATAFVARANNGPGNGEDCVKKDIGGGVVHADTKKPMANVVVTAYTNSKKEKAVTTDNTGNYSFNDLKPGTYRLVFEKSGFKKVTKDKVVIRGDEGSLLNVEMDEETEFPIIPGQLLFSDF
jgi:Carboxypeptidase regulatory-like domain